ncbi:MAG: lipocalin family protein [Porphyromonas sp.]|nr:lipocalin family protein [Porphyromonas sp.]
MQLKQVITSALLVGALSTLALTSCQSKGQTSEDKTETNIARITGQWQFSEINNGVTIQVTFHPDKKLSQYFRNAEGRDKLRPGTWDIKGDSLFVTDQTGTTKLTIESITDSTLSLLSLDSLPIYFLREKGDNIVAKP